jgi:hypothetical protein
MKHWAKAALVPPGIVALWLLAATGGAFIPGRSAPIGGEPSVRVGLVAGLIHYDFLIPARADLLERFAFVETSGVPIRLPDVEYLVIGWGAREFYTTTGSYRDLSARAVWRGIVGDTSVMRVDVVTDIPPDIPVRWLDLSDSQFAALLDRTGHLLHRVLQSRGQRPANHIGRVVRVVLVVVVVAQIQFARRILLHQLLNARLVVGRDGVAQLRVTRV